VREEKEIFWVGVYEKKSEYKYVVCLRSNKKVAPYSFSKKALPINQELLKLFLTQAIVIDYDSKKRRIQEVYFKEVELNLQTKTIENEVAEERSAHWAAVLVQARIRGILARQRALLSQNYTVIGGMMH